MSASIFFNCGCHITRDMLRRTMMMVREELVFGGAWKTAQNKINAALATTRGADNE